MDDLYAMTKKGLNPTIKSLILEINFKWVRLAMCICFCHNVVCEWGELWETARLL